MLALVCPCPVGPASAPELALTSARRPVRTVLSGRLCATAAVQPAPATSTVLFSSWSWSQALLALLLAGSLLLQPLAANAKGGGSLSESAASQPAPSAPIARSYDLAPASLGRSYNAPAASPSSIPKSTFGKVSSRGEDLVLVMAVAGVAYVSMHVCVCALCLCVHDMNVHKGTPLNVWGMSQTAFKGPSSEKDAPRQLSSKEISEVLRISKEDPIQVVSERRSALYSQRKLGGDVAPPSGTWIGTYTEDGLAGSTKYELRFDLEKETFEGTGSDADGLFDVELGVFEAASGQFVWSERTVRGGRTSLFTVCKGKVSDRNSFKCIIEGTYEASTGRTGQVTLRPAKQGSDQL